MIVVMVANMSMNNHRKNIWITGNPPQYKKQEDKI